MKPKGVATMTNIVIVTLILLTFFGFYMYMANNEVDNNIKLNLETLQFLKLKSTFSTFNQSLGTTWFISTVQSVFHAGDEAVGCGFDDGALITAGHWLQDDGAGRRNFTYANLAEMQGKYNGLSTPLLCLPRDSDIENYLKTKLAEYTDIPTEISANDADGVQINRGPPTYQASIDDAGAHSKFTQTISASYGNGKIEATTENNNFVATSLKKMAESGRNAVTNLVALEDVHANFDNEAAFFRPFGGTQSAAAYLDSIKGKVAGSVLAAAGPNIKADVIMNNIEMHADDGSKLQSSWSGLVASYSATIRYYDAPSGPQPSSAAFDFPTESKEISSCYGYSADRPVFDYGKFHAGVDIAPASPGVSEAVYSIAPGTVADVYTQCTEQSGPACGKPGYRGYGNIILVKHADFYSFYAHLASANVQTGQQVAAREQIGMMGNTGRSTGVHLHFEIRVDGTADSNSDPCGYIKCEESTRQICTPLLASQSSRYYYYDEDDGTFKKRPVTLEFQVQDTLPAMSCIWWSNYAVQNFERNVPIFFNYEKTNDVMCCNGEILSCGTSVPGLTDANSLQPGQSTSDEIQSQRNCNLIMKGSQIACTDNGFQTS